MENDSDIYSYYDEKRDYPRLKNALFVKYEIRTDLNKIVTNGISTTRDVSLGGMKLMCAARVKKGYIAKLQIKLDKITNIGVVATVAWIEEMRPGQYLIGLKFSNFNLIDKQKLIKHLNSMAPKN
ncbi:MAG: PilZ domain-containing protein [Spirochaetes bacterium]|nr:PilZ domain-containing protein [Spirochaetota bacterium]